MMPSRTGVRVRENGGQVADPEQTGGMRTRLARTARLAAVALTGGFLAAAAGCSRAGGRRRASAPPSRTLAPDPGGGGHPDAAWPTYGHDLARSGIAEAARHSLTVSWRVHLDGAVYGQPLVIGGTGDRRDRVQPVYGLSRATGTDYVDPRIGTGLVPLSAQPCGNIDPLGITGTPVYDPATGLVYAVAEMNGAAMTLAGIRVSRRPAGAQRRIPAPDHEQAYDQQRGALALAGNRIYVTFGGLARRLRAVPRLDGRQSRSPGTGR